MMDTFSSLLEKRAEIDKQLVAILQDSSSMDSSLKMKAYDMLKKAGKSVISKTEIRDDLTTTRMREDMEQEIEEMKLDGEESQRVQMEQWIADATVTCEDERWPDSNSQYGGKRINFTTCVEFGPFYWDYEFEGDNWCDGKTTISLDGNILEEISGCFLDDEPLDIPVDAHMEAIIAACFDKKKEKVGALSQSNFQLFMEALIGTHHNWRWMD